MTATTPHFHEIDGKGRTIRELLSGGKYSIDYRQREYKCAQSRVLYRVLAERIWNPDRLEQEAAS